MDGDHRPDVSVGSVVFTGFLWLLSGYIAIGALSFTFEARIAPLLFGGIGFALLTYLLIRDITRMWFPRKLDAPSETPGQSLGDSDAEGLAVDEAVALVWVLGAVLALLVLGFVVGMTLAAFAMLRIYARESTATSLALTLGVMGVLYFVFGQLLNTSLYPGLLGLFG